MTDATRARAQLVQLVFGQMAPAVFSLLEARPA